MKLQIYQFILLGIGISNIIHAKEMQVEQAKAVAEIFIQEQGYTCNRNKVAIDKIVLESITWTKSKEELLKHRFNTLKPHAIGIKILNHPNLSSWAVAFKYVTEEKDDDNCRVVTMDKDGSNIRMQHMEAFCSYFIE